MRSDCAVMIGDGSAHMEYAIGDTFKTGEKANYSNIFCFAIENDLNCLVYPDDDGATVRLHLKANVAVPGKEEQPDITIYFDIYEFGDWIAHCARVIGRFKGETEESL